MSQPNESGTIQVKRFTPPEQTSDIASATLIVTAAALLFSLVIAQIELYGFYKIILVFKTGGG